MRDIRVGCLEEWPALSALAAEWNDLLADSASSSVFLCHEWVSLWGEVFGDRFRPCILTARGPDDALLGVAPFMIGPGPGRLRRRLAHLMLIGQQGDTLAEHLDLVVRRGHEAEVTPRLLDAALERRAAWDVAFLERVPATSPVLPRVEAALREGGLDTTRHRASVSPYLPLPASWEELLGARSRNFRRQWNNSVNRLRREGPVRMHLAGRDLPLPDAYERLVELHRARWGEGRGSFRTERYLRFHRELSRSLHARGALLLAFLEVGGRYVAARYDFVHAGKVWCFQGGWRPGLERMRVGTVLLGHVLQWAIERGLEEYDFLSGGEHYKSRWATAERELVDLVAYGDKPSVRLYRRALRAKSALRRLLRR